MSFLEKQIVKSLKIVILDNNDNNLVKNYLPNTLIEIQRIIDMPSPKGKFTKQIIYTHYSDITYNDLVKGMIRERYTIEDELGIQREYKKGINEVEFNEYDSFVEECKTKAKEFIAERDQLKSL